MSILGYCPRCGYAFSDKREGDVENYNNSHCDFCGLNNNIVKAPEQYSNLSFVECIKLKRELKSADFFGQKPSIDEEEHFIWIKTFGIDKNPLYDKNVAIKVARERTAARQRRIDEYDAQRAEEAKKKLMDEVYQKMHNQPHCPTCGSTNIKKLDALDRAVSVGTLGVLSNKINKSFKCKDCGLYMVS